MAVAERVYSIKAGHFISGGLRAGRTACIADLVKQV